MRLPLCLRVQAICSAWENGHSYFLFNTEAGCRARERHLETPYVSDQSNRTAEQTPGEACPAARGAAGQAATEVGSFQSRVAQDAPDARAESAGAAMIDAELRGEINKRLTLNWLIQGAAQHAGMTFHHLVRDDCMARLGLAS